ncbi:hypothetical protein BU17DRAFT_71729 [Hysterangium stoloniferum]|nr:hypothetical protein BU17DRAFT_71729 [Hysterangium stoloniferum]
MSYHPFFVDGAPDLGDHQEYDDGASSSPNVNLNPTPTATSPRQQWDPSIAHGVLGAGVGVGGSSGGGGVMPSSYGLGGQTDLSFFSEDSSHSYYALLSNPGPSYPEQLPKIDIPSYRSSYSRYQSSSSPYFDMPSSAYQPVHTHPLPPPPPPPHPQPTRPVPDYLSDFPRHTHTHQLDVKEEPSGSPQFIFEFPGGEDALALPPDPPQFDLSATASVAFDSPAMSRDSPLPSPTRPCSPTTEAMRAMMTVFRVDPFASYEADAGTRRKRRKRGSTYARMTDPERSSKEEPLMFTFQVDMGDEGEGLDPGGVDAWGFDVGEADLAGGGASAMYASGAGSSHGGGSSGGGGGGGGGYDVYAVGGYRLQQASFDATNAPVPLIPSASRHTTPDSEYDPRARLTVSPCISNPTASAAIRLFEDAYDAPLPHPPRASADPRPRIAFDAAPAVFAQESQSQNSSSHSHAAGAYDQSHHHHGAHAYGGALRPSFALPPHPSYKPPSPRPPPANRRYRPPTKMHTCWICQKEFPRPSGLATHMNTHSGLKPYKCPIPTCSKTFAVRSNARRHLRIHGTGSGSLLIEPGSESGTGGFDDEPEDGEGDGDTEGGYRAGAGGPAARSAAAVAAVAAAVEEEYRGCFAGGLGDGDGGGGGVGLAWRGVGTGLGAGTGGSARLAAGRHGVQGGEEYDVRREYGLDVIGMGVGVGAGSGSGSGMDAGARAGTGSAAGGRASPEEERLRYPSSSYVAESIAASVMNIGVEGQKDGAFGGFEQFKSHSHPHTHTHSPHINALVAY